MVYIFIAATIFWIICGFFDFAKKNIKECISDFCVAGWMLFTTLLVAKVIGVIAFFICMTCLCIFLFIMTVKGK